LDLSVLFRTGFARLDIWLQSLHARIMLRKISEKEPPMRLLSACVLATICLATPLSANARTMPTSCGKLGVTLAQYRQDAVDCGTAAYYRDVSDTDAAKAFKRATSELESNEARIYTSFSTGAIGPAIGVAVESDTIVHAAQPMRRFREIRELQQQTLAQCLTQRGYRQFSLTRSQLDHLRRLRNGSPERHAYLYGLSVDPEVLTEQAS
jgi:hypothetical protein